MSTNDGLVVNSIWFRDVNSSVWTLIAHNTTVRVYGPQHIGSGHYGEVNRACFRTDGSMKE